MLVLFHGMKGNVGDTMLIRNWQFNKSGHFLDGIESPLRPQTVSSPTLRFRSRSEGLVRRAALQHLDRHVNGRNGPSMLGKKRQLGEHAAGDLMAVTSPFCMMLHRGERLLLLLVDCLQETSNLCPVFSKGGPVLLIEPWFPRRKVR